jgi:hypothetical protein
VVPLRQRGHHRQGRQPLNEPQQDSRGEHATGQPVQHRIAWLSHLDRDATSTSPWTSSGQFWVAILMALGDEIELRMGELTP